MSALAGAVADYLLVRRALGYKLARSEKLLAQFVAYCDQVGATTVRTETAVAWAQLPSGGGAWWWSQRLGVVRAFATWLQAQDPACEVPPAGVFGPAQNRRAVPYLYTEAEVVALMEAASRLRYPLQRATYRALVGLCPHPRAPSFFVSSAGTRLVYTNVSSLFHKLVRLAGLAPRSERCRPRMHDFRHRFAVLTMLDWHRDGRDVEALLPRLSTFMGHTDPKHTYWYLSGTPELFALAAERLDRHEQGRRA